MSSQSLPLQLYFGYGSNLWLEQMHLRCPSSNYMGVGRLAGYRWIINGRGYANVVSSDKPHDVVYGLIYSLTSSDEAALDINEGVPHAYTKEIIAVEYWKSHNESSKVSSGIGGEVDVTQPGEEIGMLVYIDRYNIHDDKPKAEYIYRINKGIADAVSLGVPMDYFEEHIRHFIPPTTSKEIQELAEKQAKSFKEEGDP